MQTATFGPRRRWLAKHGSTACFFASATVLACGSSTQHEHGDAGQTSADAADAGPCERHAECVERHGPQWICRARDHACVNLSSDDCDFVRGDSAAEDAVFVGVLSPEGGAGQFFGATELVRQDFSAAVGGLPLEKSAKAHPFVLVGCTFPYGGDPLPAARRLVEDIGVPAIIGPATSEDVVKVAQNLTIPADVVLMSPFAQSDVLTNLADDDLVFRTNPTTKSVARQLAAMLSDVEKVVRAERSLDVVKVAAVSARDTYGIALSNATIDVLRFNGGLSCDENEQRGRFLAISYDESEKGFESSVAKRLVAFQPSIVVLLTAFDVRVFKSTELAWTGGEASAPYYVMDAGGESSDYLKFVASRPDALRKRLRIAANLDPERPLYESYQSRVDGEFGSSALLRVGASIYDATYALAYAIVAAGKRAPSGDDIKKGIRRLTSGSRIDAVPAQIERGVSLLRAGGKIDLEGASGPLDFDEHGDVTSDGSVDCLERDESTNAVSAVFSGQVYRAAQGKLEGSYQCE